MTNNKQCFPMCQLHCFLKTNFQKKKGYTDSVKIEQIHHHLFGTKKIRWGERTGKVDMHHKNWAISEPASHHQIQHWLFVSRPSLRTVWSFHMFSPDFNKIILSPHVTFPPKKVFHQNLSPKSYPPHVTPCYLFPPQKIGTFKAYSGTLALALQRSLNGWEWLGFTWKMLQPANHQNLRISIGWIFFRWSLQRFCKKNLGDWYNSLDEFDWMWTDVDLGLTPHIRKAAFVGNDSMYFYTPKSWKKFVIQVANCGITENLVEIDRSRGLCTCNSI